MAIPNNIPQPNGERYDAKRTRVALTARSGQLIAVQTAVAALAIQLEPAGNPGACIAVGDDDSNAAANPITISVEGGGTIDGSATKTIATAGQVLQFVDDGSQWRSIVPIRQIYDTRRGVYDSVAYSSDASSAVQISTLYGDGTAGSPGTPQDNPSHILGDTISWEPTRSPTEWIKEFAGKVSVNNAPTVLAVVPIANLETYTIDVTTTAKRHDGTGVAERWKLSAVLNRDDALGGGVLYDATQTEADGITTKAGTATVLGLTIDTTGNVLSVIFSGIAGAGNTADYRYAIRIGRQVTGS